MTLLQVLLECTAGRAGRLCACQLDHRLLQPAGPDRAHLSHCICASLWYTRAAAEIMCCVKWPTCQPACMHWPHAMVMPRHMGWSRPEHASIYRGPFDKMLCMQTMANQVSSMVLLSTGGAGNPDAFLVTQAQLLGIFAGAACSSVNSCLSQCCKRPACPEASAQHLHCAKSPDEPSVTIEVQHLDYMQREAPASCTCTLIAWVQVLGSAGLPPAAETCSAACSASVPGA